MNYGLSYVGSKGLIAEKLVDFFSSYDISDNRFYKVFETNKSSRIAKTDRNGKRPETVYSNIPMKKFAFGC